jgi:hypothetical protein
MKWGRAADTGFVRSHGARLMLLGDGDDRARFGVGLTMPLPLEARASTVHSGWGCRVSNTIEPNEKVAIVSRTTGVKCHSN